MLEMKKRGGVLEMKKAEIIAALAERTGVSKADAERVYNETFNIFKEELSKKNSVSVNGFGTFKISERAAREGRNPMTGEKIQIAASKSVSFKVAKDLKESVNK